MPDSTVHTATELSSQDLYKILAEASFEAVFLSEKGICTGQNKTARELFGYRDDEAIGLPGTEWIHPDSRHIVHQKMLSGAADTYEVVALRKDGTSFPCEIQAKIINSENTPIRITALRDITARKERERSERGKKRAEAGSKAKSEFLAHMSHEIRTPLNAILVANDLLDETDLTDSQREILQLQKTSGTMLMNIVNDILDFSKIEAGQLNLEEVPFDLLALIEEQHSMFNSKATQKGLELTCAISSKNPRCVIGDPTRIRQVLTNLISNAIKFTPRGKITIGVEPDNLRQDQESTLFSVKDTGIGIAVDKQQAIFGSFHQADRSTTRRFGGTGLGLTISKRLVELMGGQIGVISQEHSGSTFCFSIPLPRTQSTQNTRDPSKQIPESRAEEHETFNFSHHSLLLVDDIELNRTVINNLLSGTDMTVYQADSTENALERYATKGRDRFDVILIDLEMDVDAGPESAKNIRNFETNNNLPPVPIIALSAHAFSWNRDQFLAAGCNHFLAKPITRKKLLQAICSQLQQ